MAKTGIRITHMDLSGIQRLKNMDVVNELGEASATELTGDIVLSFGTSPPGRTYNLGGGRTHVASQPGFPPNVLFNELRGSMRWVPAGDKVWHIQDGVEHGIKMEQGDPVTNTAPRPFMGPVFENWKRGRWKQFAVQFLRARIK